MVHPVTTSADDIIEAVEADKLRPSDYEAAHYNLQNKVAILMRNRNMKNISQDYYEQLSRAIDRMSEAIERMEKKFQKPKEKVH